MLTPYRKIMVPLDGSDLAEQALPHAQAIAEQLGSGLVLFGVAPDAAKGTGRSPMVPEMMGTHQVYQVDEQPLVDHFTALLDERAAQVRLHHVDVDVVVEVGSPAERIVDYAAEKEVDLIVMSTHGRTGVGRWVYGSVANKVIGHAPCPVLLVRVSPEELTTATH